MNYHIIMLFVFGFFFYASAILISLALEKIFHMNDFWNERLEKLGMTDKRFP